MKENNLYKVLRINEWEDASRTGSIVAEVDQEDGFIHLSTAVQLAANQIPSRVTSDSPSLSEALLPNASGRLSQA